MLAADLRFFFVQVLNLVHLFSPKRIRLQPYQKPKSRVIWDYKISLAHTGLESSLHTHSHACPSSSMVCNSRISLPHSSFMYAKQNAKHAAYKYESPLRPRPKSVIFKAPDIKEKSLELNADYIPLELDDLDDCKSDSDAVLSNMLGTVSFYSALLSSISYEDRDPKPFNGKRDEGDGYHSPVLNRRFISESETGQNSAIAHIMKERLSSMQGKGCKRKVQFNEHSDLSSPSCTMAKKVFFNFGGDEISVTSDKALQRPAHAELEENREAIIEKRKQEVGCLVQDIQSKGGDVSAKRSKLMSLSFPEGLTNKRVQSCSRNSQSLVTQSGIKLTYTLLTDEE